MDFYYTTATVKTVLFHPNQQRTTQLFRRCLQQDPAIFVKILQNPRYHSGLGYYNNVQRGNQQSMANSAMENIDDPMNAEEDSEMKEEEAEGTNTNVTYYAKNDDYAFDAAGHENRQAAMAKLQPTPEFQAWEKATKQDWACVHAKCFASLRRYMRPKDGPRRGRSSREEEERMHLPDMAPVVQVQAARNATVSTNFYATGPSAMPLRKSRVRMERIKGLNDDPEWGTGPVFDLKLYYRAEATMNEEGITKNEDDDDENMKDSDADDTNDNMENADVSLADKLRDTMPLEAYKADKVDQLHRWYQECKALDKSEADARVIQVQKSIEEASTQAVVDEHLKAYWDWHIQQEWANAP